MTIETDYGTVDYEEENLITFVDGLFGFPALKRYLFLSLDENDDSMLMMQSVEDVSVGFALVNPYVLYPDYSPELTPEELSCLKVTDKGELSYYSGEYRKSKMSSGHQSRDKTGDSGNPGEFFLWISAQVTFLSISNGFCKYGRWE